MERMCTRLALLLLFIGLPLASTTCRARGYGSPGSACQNTQCSSWGVGSRCCGTNDGYCGEYTSSNPSQWISTCGNLDFIRVWPGCSIEVATSGNGGGSRYTYTGDAQ